MQKNISIFFKKMLQKNLTFSVNKLIEKISVKEDEVVIRFKININEIRSKALKKSGSMVPENKLEDKSVILDSLKIYPNPE